MKATSARNNIEMHELKLVQGAIDCVLPQPARLSLAVESSWQQGHMPRLGDSAWQANKYILFHWRVEECDSDVVDTQDTLARLRSKHRS